MFWLLKKLSLMTTPWQLPHKIPLALIPTPIEDLSLLSHEYGISLKVKRDDLTGSDLSGNKVRKLEYLLAEAQQLQCDTVITCGAVTSNHARATAIASRRLGFDSLLLLAGEPPVFAQGNLQLDLLVGAKVQYITKQIYSLEINNALQEAAESLKREGKTPYIIPTGGSNPMGMMGYVETIREIKEQCQAMNWVPEYIVCAVGSGGTYSGLLLGSRLYDFPVKIMGILVCGGLDSFREKIFNDIQNAIKRFNLPVEIQIDSILLHDDYISGGYAKTDSSQIRLQRHVAQNEAIILDPVYTGKAFYGMVQELNNNRISPNSNVLFVHTGGIFGLSAFSEIMTQEWNSLTYWPI